MSDVKFKGIVAVGSSQGQAVQRYRMLSMGKGARCFVDQANGTAFVSNASSDIESVFNPTNGNLDLSLSDDALQGLQFEAQASDTQDAYWMHCTSGCGAHSVFDSRDLVNNCPMCGQAADTSEEDADEEDSELDELVVGEDGDGEEVDLDEDEIDEEEEFDDGDDADDEEEDADEEDDSALASDDNDSSDEDDSDDSDDDSEDDDSDDDSDEDDEEEVEIEEDIDTEESNDMADDNAPLVVVASTRARAVRGYADQLSQNTAFQATASSAVNAEYMVCSSDECGAHVVSSEPLTNCPAEGCGAELEEPVLALDAVDGEEADDLENEQDEEDLEADEADVNEDEDDDISDDEEDDAIENADDVTDEDEEAADDVGADNSLSLTDEGSAVATASTVTAAEDEEAAEDIADESDDVEDNDSDTVEMDLLEEMPDDASEADLDIAFASSIAGQPTYIALHKGVPVATAVASNVNQDVQPLFGTPQFQHVTHAASRLKSPKAVLKDLGFKGIAATLNVSNNVAKRVAAEVAEARSQMDVERGESAERLESAIATSMIGITRGFFEGQTNAVREALCSELSEVGIRNPETIVDRAMKAGFEPFLGEAMSRAKHILEKTPEVQDELARTVMEMGYMPKSAPAEQAATASASAPHRLDGIGNAVTASSAVKADTQKPASTSQIAAQASDQQNLERIHAAVGSLGLGRGRGR